MAMIGYARVSSVSQSLEVQEKALRAAGCDLVRSEKVSGTKRNGRTELQTILDFLRPGDTVTVTRIDRLARSLRDLLNVVEEIRQKGAHLKVTEQNIDTSNAAGRAFLNMLGTFAEFETTLRQERQAEGIREAKERGAYTGRKPVIDAAQVREMRDAGRTPTEIGKAMGISRDSVYRLLGQQSAA